MDLQFGADGILLHVLLKLHGFASSGTGVQRKVTGTMMLQPLTDVVHAMTVADTCLRARTPIDDKDRKGDGGKYTDRGPRVR